MRACVRACGREGRERGRERARGCEHARGTHAVTSRRRRSGSRRSLERTAQGAAEASARPQERAHTAHTHDSIAFAVRSARSVASRADARLALPPPPRVRSSAASSRQSKLARGEAAALPSPPTLPPAPLPAPPPAPLPAPPPSPSRSSGNTSHSECIVLKSRSCSASPPSPFGKLWKLSTGVAPPNLRASGKRRRCVPSRSE